MSDDPRESQLLEFETEFPGQLAKGVQFKDKEFEHGMFRKWPDGRTCMSRISRDKRAWVFVRLATMTDIASVAKMLMSKKNAVKLLGDK